MTILQIKEKRAAIRTMSNDTLVKSFGEFLQAKPPFYIKDERIRAMYESEFQRRSKEG